MRELIDNGHDFRIIPENYESATVFDVKSITEEAFEADLIKANEEELKDYANGSEVEIFCSSPSGLIFFESKILEQNEKLIKLEMPKAYKNIQRREYSRVKFFGEIELEGNPDTILNVEDISAGGMRFICSKPLNIAQNYPAKITLINNLEINCTLHPIRIQEENYKGETAYAISCCFNDLSSIDRVALVQYTFKVLMETENKENE